MDKNIREKLQTQKDNLNLWIRKKVEEIVMNLLATLRPQLQEKLKDPYMCDCVKYFVDDCVDEVWPHIEEEVLEKLRLNIADPYSEKVNVKPKVCCLLIPW